MSGAGSFGGMESSAYEAGQAVGGSVVILLLLGAVIGGGIFFIIATIKAFTRKTPGWIIGSILSGIVALGGLLGAAGVAVNSVAKAAKTHREAKAKKDRISSPDGKVGISVPGNWKPIPNLNEAASISAGNEFLEQYAVIIENPKSDFAGDLKDFDEQVTGMISGNLQDPEVSEAEDRMIGEYPALHRRIFGISDKIRVVYLMSSVETADGFYQILTWTLPSREESAAPILQEVIDSFSSEAGPPGADNGGESRMEREDPSTRATPAPEAE